MAGDRYANVDAYFDAQGEPKATTLRAIYAAITKAYPEAVIKLAWNVPQVQIDGKYIFGADAAKNHISVSPWSDAVMADFDSRLTAYTRTKGLFRVPVDWDVDTELITDLVAARLAELGLSS